MSEHITEVTDILYVKCELQNHLINGGREQRP